MACVVAILASTSASAATKPSASAQAALVAKVQPVPWVWGVSMRGRASQPRAWGVSIQSSERPGACTLSPPVMATACGPSARKAWARVGMVAAADS